jgi:hypothetical protein
MCFQVIFGDNLKIQNIQGLLLVGFLCLYARFVYAHCTIRNLYYVTIQFAIAWDYMSFASIVYHFYNWSPAFLICYYFYNYGVTIKLQEENNKFNFHFFSF